MTPSPGPAPTIHRRAFLRAAACAPAALALPGCSGPRGERPVVVVGAGLTGLLVARGLEARGARVVLLEARPRIGGRVLTLRQGLPAGLRAEAGAERVGKADHRVRALLDELGLGLLPAPAATARRAMRWTLAGEVFAYDEQGRLPEALLAGLTFAERGAAPFDLHHLYLRAAAPPTDDDPRTGLQWLLDHGLSARGADLVRAFCYHPIATMSAAALYHAAVVERGVGDAAWIAGGSDRLTAAVHGQLREPARRGKRVVRVLPDAGHHDAVTVTSAAGERIHAAACAVCLPLPVLGSGVELPAELRAQVDARLRQQVLVQEVKLHAAVPEALFEQQRLPGYAFAGGPPQTASWCMAETQAATTVHTTMGFGTTMPAVEAAAPYRALGLATLGHDFSTDPLAAGAYPTTPAGARRPGADTPRAGRIVLAGADLSSRPGWLEGAVESAAAAIAQVAALLP